MQKERIKINGHIGTWYVINECHHKGNKVYLLEHEQYGDEAACLIVDESLSVFQDNVWNGFNDLTK